MLERGNGWYREETKFSLHYWPYINLAQYCARFLEKVVDSRWCVSLFLSVLFPAYHLLYCLFSDLQASFKEVIREKLFGTRRYRAIWTLSFHSSSENGSKL